MNQPILKVSNLSKTFGGVVATDHLNLEIKHGELHAIIGPNGAGKTTLIAQLSGETLPDSGEIIFREENITAAPPFKRSRLGIARSFQITSLMLEMDVIDNITLATLSQDNHSYKFWKPAREDIDLRKSALNALKEIGLEERAFEKVGNLSHGEHRQLEIAMALATQPHLLLLDEPTSALDSQSEKLIQKSLSELSKSSTTITIAHRLSTIVDSDKVLVLDNGKIVGQGKHDSLVKKNELYSNLFKSQIEKKNDE